MQEPSRRTLTQGLLLYQDASIGEALDVMIAHNTSVVMVVDDDEVIGLLTAGDMSSMVARGIDIETRRARDFASL